MADLPPRQTSGGWATDDGAKDAALHASASIEALAAQHTWLVAENSTLREELRSLADEAARAVCEPRRFHENEDDRQQLLGKAVARARLGMSMTPLLRGTSSVGRSRKRHGG